MSCYVKSGLKRAVDAIVARDAGALWYWVEAFDQYGDKRYYESQNREKVERVEESYKLAGHKNITHGSYRQ